MITKPQHPPQRPLVTRFAPSPTGLLHLGHAFSAITAFDAAKASGGRFVVRIEDIDAGRARPEFEAAIFEDLAWLGLPWETPVRRQSEHMADYAEALSNLEARGLIYPCTCSRREINAEIKAATAAPHAQQAGAEGPLYPGTCRKKKGHPPPDGEPYALRLDMGAAIAEAGALVWTDETKGAVKAQPETFGDVVLARKDTPTSYHLAVTVDDHIQGVSRVVRGEDLFDSTHVHRVLQALLGLETPHYHHHRLIPGENGQRLAKRDRAATLKALRDKGASAADVRQMLDLPPAP